MRSKNPRRSKAASVGGLFHSYQIVTTYSVSICSFSLRTAAIAVCVFKTAPGASVARKSLISLSSLPGSPLLSNILTFIFSLHHGCIRKNVPWIGTNGICYFGCRDLDIVCCELEGGRLSWRPLSLGRRGPKPGPCCLSTAPPLGWARVRRVPCRATDQSVPT